MKKLSMLLALILALCALPALAEQGSADPRLDGLMSLVAEALPEREPELRPVGSGTLFGAEVQVNEDGEPPVDLIYFLLETQNGTWLRGYLREMCSAYRIDEGDVAAVNALMADWNEEHLEIEFQEGGILLVYSDCGPVEDQSDEALISFIRAVFDQTRDGLAELRRRAADYLPEYSGNEAAVSGITREMVEAAVDAVRAERDIAGDIVTATVDEAQSVVTLGGDCFAADVSAPDRPDCWLVYRLLYDNTVAVDLWDRNGNYTVAGTAIADAKAAVDQWNEDSGGRRLWLEYGEDGTLYGEFGMVISGVVTEDMAVNAMALFTKQACEALDFLDGKLSSRYAPSHAFDDFSMPIPGGAELTLNGKGAEDGVYFALDDGNGANTVRCLWSAQAADIADLDYTAFMQSALDDLSAGMKRKGLTSNDYSLQGPTTSDSTLDGKAAAVCYVPYTVTGAGDGQVEMRQHVALTVADPAFGTYFFLFDAEYPDSYFTLIGALEALRWNEGR